MANRTLAGRPRTVLEMAVDRSDDFWSLYRGWVDPIDTTFGADEVVRVYSDRRLGTAMRDELGAALERRSALQRRVIDGWDDPARTPDTSRRACWTRCPITGREHQQSFCDLVAYRCTCAVCARVRAGQDLCSMAEATDRRWIIDELLAADPNLNPWTIAGNSRQDLPWMCRRCGRVDTASPHGRLKSTTGFLPCCRAIVKEQIAYCAGGRHKKRRQAPAAHQRANSAQLQALREQSLGTIGLKAPAGGTVTVTGDPILFENNRGRLAVALTTQASGVTGEMECPRTAPRIISRWAVRDVDGQWHGGRTGLYVRTDVRGCPDSAGHETCRIVGAGDSVWTYVVGWCGNERHRVQVLPAAEALRRLKRGANLLCDTCAYERDRQLIEGSVIDLGEIELDWSGWGAVDGASAARAAAVASEVERRDGTVDRVAPLYPVTTRWIEPRSVGEASVTRQKELDDSVEALLAALERGVDLDALADLALPPW